jgi:hypothetical protein
MVENWPVMIERVHANSAPELSCGFGKGVVSRDVTEITLHRHTCCDVQSIPVQRGPDTRPTRVCSHAFAQSAWRAADWPNAESLPDRQSQNLSQGNFYDRGSINSPPEGDARQPRKVR